MKTKEKLSAVLRETHPMAEQNLRDSYVLDFWTFPNKLLLERKLDEFYMLAEPWIEYKIKNN